MKKVLVIAYYWPPSGSSSVQRVLKFCKYLGEFGWQPVVLTVRAGHYSAADGTFLQEIPASTAVYRTKSLEPHSGYKAFTGVHKDAEIPVNVMEEKNANWKKRVAFWIRINVFLPDSRIGWAPYAVRRGKKILKDEDIKVIFSSAPPATAHLIAKKLSRWSGTPWVADFRDPWTNIYYKQQSGRFFLSRIIDESLEKASLRAADAVTSVSDLDIKTDYYPKAPAERKYFYLPNGYDEEDFAGYAPATRSARRKDAVFITHIGSVGAERVPRNLLKAVAMLRDEGAITPENFSLTFIGNTESSLVLESKKLGVEELIALFPYVPHKDIFVHMREATVLLLLITNVKDSAGIVPGKTFEYLRSGVPLLVFGDTDGEVARIIAETGTGETFDYEDYDGVLRYLRTLLSASPGEYRPRSETIHSYERRILTKKLAEIFDSLA